ncbi:MULTISPECIES: hypothetical protein [Sutcliffiella]|uniref:Uncharacterized protein n=1 Tax=Sutcliffiella cohnii TaxID=33932 RepID=A0A223KXN8_9BACI|nr:MULTISPECIES: hypothetical protein [Sutcliffiella]AST94174.1 hypothetical protein BC6307_24520 [Sutcliffiella cohnii]WBL15391.1 hypothetical protein O1A01_01640 [Sutcliffiella sp. NC1]
MTVKFTNDLSSVIQKHKKMLEKSELYTYYFFYNSKKYYQCIYLRFKKTTGVVILDETGAVVPKSTAVKVAYYINSYNNFILDVTRVIIPEMRKSYKPIEEKYELLMKITSKTEDSAFHKYFSILDEILCRRRRLPEIVEEFTKLHDEVLRTNHLDLEIYHRALNIGEEFNEIVFSTAMRLTEAVPITKKIKEDRKLYQQEDFYPEVKRLVAGINDFLSPSSLKELEKSVRLLGEDEVGNHQIISADEKGMELAKELVERNGKKDFERKVIPIIRNGD